MRCNSGVRSISGGFSTRSIAINSATRSVSGANTIFIGGGSGGSGFSGGGGTTIVEVEKKDPQDIIDFKKYLFDVLISPLIQSQEEYLKKNIYLLYLLKNRFEELKIQYKDFDFKTCEDTIELIDVAFSQYDIARKYESVIVPKDGLANISVQIERIVLKAEYEIYHILYGYPDIKCKKTYDTDILDAIKSILYNENKIIYTFEEVKQKLIELELLKDENNDNQHDDQLLHHYPISK